MKRHRWCTQLEAGLVGLSAIGFGVYLLARRDWVAGAFVILIGVTGGLPALEPLLVHRDPSASRIDLVAVDGSYQQGLVFPLSRGKQWVRLPMFIALAAVYVFIAVAVASPLALSRRRFWHRAGDPDVVLPVDDLVAAEDEFRRTLERCLADPEARRAIGFERAGTELVTG